jgi:hypothetical protein
MDYFSPITWITTQALGAFGLKNQRIEFQRRLWKGYELPFTIVYRKKGCCHYRVVT